MNGIIELMALNPLLAYITFTLTGGVLFLLGWTLGLSYGLKQRALISSPILLDYLNNENETE
jgi:hypothetical protein